MICEQCGKELGADDVPPLCLEHYVECMEDLDQQLGEGLAALIIKMGNEPGVTIHFPTSEGYKKMEKGKISDSPFGKVH